MLRKRRDHLGMTQQELAKELGIAFQQVQKYEKGLNRVSASKLYEIAAALKVPTSYFFAGFNGKLTQPETGDIEQNIQNFFMTMEGIDLAEHFPRIKNKAERQQILELIRSLAEDKN